MLIKFKNLLLFEHSINIVNLKLDNIYIHIYINEILSLQYTS